jgi:hypothetical protein
VSSSGGHGDPGQPPEELECSTDVKSYLDEGLAQLEAAREDVPGRVAYGASNFPHDPTVWAADWRDRLPPDDPRRHDRNDPVVKNGSLEAYRTMEAADRAIRVAYGRAPFDPDHHS